jgi:GT2 family glycosyltransferase
LAGVLAACFEEDSQVIPVLGFATLKRFDLADRLLASIDYPVDHLVVVNNSGAKTWQPSKPELVKNLWHIEVPFGLGLVGAWNLVVKSTPYAPYWVLVNDDAWFEPGQLANIPDQVDTQALNFLDIVPQWSGVVFGEGMVDKVGLYDENFYPLYFDDNDLERRVDLAGVPKKSIACKLGHNNSSTLHSGYQNANSVSYSNNHNLYAQNAAEGRITANAWQLSTRRANRWD